MKISNKLLSTSEVWYTQPLLSSDSVADLHFFDELDGFGQDSAWFFFGLQWPVRLHFYSLIRNSCPESDRIVTRFISQGDFLSKIPSSRLMKFLIISLSPSEVLYTPSLLSSDSNYLLHWRNRFFNLPSDGTTDRKSTGFAGWLVFRAARVVAVSATLSFVFC